jgi:rod shape-determining protein MreC
VPSNGNDASPLFADADASTLRLVGWGVCAVALMLADHRGGFLEALRREAATLAGPVYWVASAPARAGRTARELLAERRSLAAENLRLRERLLLAEARLARMDAVAGQNDRLRELLDARTRLGLQAQLGELIEVDLEPFRHRVLIDLGAGDGIATGQAVMDAHGVLGQVVEVHRGRAVLILLTDPGHAIPVRVARTGLRAIAYGSGDAASLNLPHIPFSAGVRAGDLLVTSGIGGGFPAGLPVGTIRSVEPDDSATFVRAVATPAASMARSGEVLVLHDQRVRLGDGSAAVEFSGPPEDLVGPPADGVAGAPGSVAAPPPGVLPRGAP